VETSALWPPGRARDDDDGDAKNSKQIIYLSGLLAIVVLCLQTEKTDNCNTSNI